jgi:hypothetical protein
MSGRVHEHGRECGVDKFSDHSEASAFGPMMGGGWPPFSWPRPASAVSDILPEEGRGWRAAAILAVIGMILTTGLIVWCN